MSKLKTRRKETLRHVSRLFYAFEEYEFAQHERKHNNIIEQQRGLEMENKGNMTTTCSDPHHTSAPISAVYFAGQTLRP